MIHAMNKTIWTVLVLSVLAAVLLFAPHAFADGGGAVSDASDKITIAEDGTATLFSSHMAGEEVCSLQVSFTVPAGTTFEFGGTVADRMTSQKTVDGVLTIYISGAEPLLLPGRDALLLGTFAPAEGVRPVESSLAFVYGSRVISQTLEVDPLELSAREQLQALVDIADSMELLGEPQQEALNKAKEVLAKEDATDEQLDEAYNYLYGQLYEQDSGGSSGGVVNDERAALETELKKAGELDPSAYDKDTVGALNEAIDMARAALDGGSQDDIKAARAALAAAISGLKKVGQPRLEAALDKARATLNDGKSYSAQSRQALEDAIQAAEAVLADPDATSEERTAAALDLEEATENMVPQGSDPSGPVYDENGGSGLEGSGDDPTQTPAQTASADATAAPAATSAATPSSTAAVPNTGDETVLAPWLALLCLCAGMLTVLAIRRGKADR